MPQTRVVFRKFVSHIFRTQGLFPRLFQLLTWCLHGWMTRDDLIRSDRHKTLFPYHHSACACRYHHIWPSRSVSHLSISCSRGDRLTVTILIFTSFYVFSVRGNSAINTSTNWSTSIRFFAIFSLTCYKYICSQLSCFSVLVSLISIVSVSIFIRHFVILNRLSYAATPTVLRELEIHVHYPTHEDNVIGAPL